MTNGTSSSAVIEITSVSIKLMVGFLFDGEIYTYYAYEKTLPEGIMQDGLIIDPHALSEEIKSISEIYDSSARLKIKITDAYLGLPSMGLQVFDDSRVCETISEDNKVNETDMKNLRNMISKQNLNGDIMIIDIVPNNFTLDGGRQYQNPPLGETAREVKLDAKVYSLPKSTYESYVRVFKDSGISLRRAIVSSVSTVSYINDIKTLPENYLLLDVGARLSSVSLVGKKQLYGTNVFYWGSEKITDDIINDFSCSRDEANKVKKVFGYDTRKLSFSPYVYKYTNEEGETLKYTVDDLNEIILTQLNKFVGELKTSIDKVSEGNERIKSLPIVIIGGGSSLFGFIDYLKNNISNQLIPIVPKTVGARKPGLFTCLGLLKTAQTNQAGLAENIAKTVSISREEK